MSFINKLESRNSELDQSVKIMRPKIQILEEGTIEPAPNRCRTDDSFAHASVPASNTDQMIADIHARVTRLVLKLGYPAN